MLSSSRICMLALLLAAALLVPVALGSSSTPGLTLVPTRFTGAVPLTVPRHRAARPVPLGRRAVRLAARELGVPYRYGGSSPSGFDCSGLVAFVYGKLGIRLPHNAAAQFAYGHAVSSSHLQPGDLVFFHGLGHVGLYIGRGRIIHAPQTGERVEIQRLAARSGSVEGARRLTAN
jgi:cell wall-associated NlpC family hydrolase